MRAGHLTLALALAIGFSALGTWQVQRRAWKLQLIDRVERHLRSPAEPAPGPEHWGTLSSEDAYQPVAIQGTFLHEREALVQAVTAEGPGFWVITPLRSSAGFTVLVNRGFVPADLRASGTRQAGAVGGVLRLEGLLRLTEPGGGFLRRNDPIHDRWYSRDVAAIGASRGIAPQELAPYFVDADASPNPGGWPMGGLTVVRFRNSHLIYALTWYGLALLSIAGAAIVIRDSPAMRTKRQLRA